MKDKPDSGSQPEISREEFLILERLAAWEMGMERGVVSERMTQQRLLVQSMMSTAALSKLLHQMDIDKTPSRGWVVRTEDPGNRRQKFVELTAAGRRQLIVDPEAIKRILKIREEEPERSKKGIQ